jgi:hypothetical protein
VIALLVGSVVIGASVVSWYGYKTLVRIRTWGEKMNEVDAIFQSVATPEEMAGTSPSGPPRKPRIPVPTATQAAIGVPH